MKILIKYQSYLDDDGLRATPGVDHVLEGEDRGVYHLLHHREVGEDGVVHHHPHRSFQFLE